MMKRLIILVAGIGLLGYSASGQSKKELIEYADQAYEKGNFASSAYFYHQVVTGGGDPRFDATYPYEVSSWSGGAPKKIDSTESENLSPSQMRYQHATHMLANSYRQLRDYDNAKLWYEAALQMPDEEFEYARYWYATVLMSLEQYSKAQNEIETFMAEIDEDDEFYQLAQNQLVSCQFALNPSNTREGVAVDLMDSVFNAGNSSFGASFFEGELSIVFSSARPGNYIDEEDAKDGKESEYITDLFVSTNLGDGWEAPFRMEGPINSGQHDGAGQLSADRTTFYFTRWDEDNKNECHIYVTKKINARWFEPQKLDLKVNVDGYRSLGPALNLDETRLYFASDRPGGYGGLDIWYCPMEEDGTLANPVNLGPTVNTPDDETTPFHHFQTNTLFFSSKGHIGFGGYDVYSTKYDEDNDSWSIPINVGAPVNSSKDDTHYTLNKEQSGGFVTSDRVKCTDCDSTAFVQGYCNQIYEITMPDLTFSISGYVFDNETMEPIANSLITLKDIKGGWAPIFIMTDDQGFYERELEQGWDIFMKAQKSGYFGDAATASTSGLTVSTALEQDFFLNKQPPSDQELVIEGIEYDFDKATLRPKSKEVLDKLVEFLELNDNLTIEIQAHTDARGNDAYNLDLSNRRAQSVVDYLVDAGIDRTRLKPKGYGETTPAPMLDEDKKVVRDDEGEIKRLTETYINSLGSEDDREEAHQRNRRTAFKVLAEDNTNIISTPDSE